jgi:hypothetical protein
MYEANILFFACFACFVTSHFLASLAILGVFWVGPRNLLLLLAV